MGITIYRLRDFLISQGRAIVPIRVRRDVVHIERKQTVQEAIAGVRTTAQSLYPFYNKISVTRYTQAGETPRMPPLRGVFIREGRATAPSRVRRDAVHNERKQTVQEAIAGDRTTARPQKADNVCRPKTVAIVCRLTCARIFRRNKPDFRNKRHAFNVLRAC